MSIVASLFSPSALWTLLAILFGAWLVFSWVLRYHWRSYSAHSPATKRASWIYFTVSIIAFIIAAILIVSL